MKPFTTVRFNYLLCAADFQCEWLCCRVISPWHSQALQAGKWSPHNHHSFAYFWISVGWDDLFTRDPFVRQWWWQWWLACNFTSLTMLMVMAMTSCTGELGQAWCCYCLKDRWWSQHDMVWLQRKAIESNIVGITAREVGEGSVRGLKEESREVQRVP